MGGSDRQLVKGLHSNGAVDQEAQDVCMLIASCSWLDCSRPQEMTQNLDVCASEAVRGAWVIARHARHRLACRGVP
jgi:hypothetical protein